jgi:hypothetical protein
MLPPAASNCGWECNGLKSALTTPLENSVGVKPAHPKQALSSLQLASSAHATARGN